MPSAFISYVRDNSAMVDKLAEELREHEITVWLDRNDILPGERWQTAIRQAIEEGEFFIACFSAESVARRRSYMNTELGLAIDILQQMPADRIWFIPVLLSEYEVPDWDVGGGKTLRDLQWVELYKDWSDGISRILWAIGTHSQVPAKSVDRQRIRQLIRGFEWGNIQLLRDEYEATSARLEVELTGNLSTPLGHDTPQSIAVLWPEPLNCHSRCWQGQGITHRD